MWLQGGLMPHAPKDPGCYHGEPGAFGDCPYD